ncbi:hypothetical protein GCM10010423_77690 [Streptomyces levis]|uniref:Uncharacterized protein n=1 Tax=Streptomyces levis TaxID=285566 RepID=A0ABN3P634_9ACTN
MASGEALPCSLPLHESQGACAAPERARESFRGTSVLNASPDWSTGGLAAFLRPFAPRPRGTGDVPAPGFDPSLNCALWQESFPDLANTDRSTMR